MPHFTKYLARCNYMLESGKPVSDVLMYLGDEQNHKPPQSLNFPEGYSYDYCNPDVLLNRLSVKNGQMVTPEGISYRVLWLYDCKRMLPETVEKILSFAKQGITIVGKPPTGIATLKGGKTGKIRFQKAVESLWGDGSQNIREVGKGKVYSGNIESALTAEEIQPDIKIKFSDIRWLHRRTADSDIYFLSAPVGKDYKGNITFRSKGAAEIWDPLTGGIINIKPVTTENSFTQIEMDLPAGTSCFVVFHRNVTPQPHKAAPITEKMEIKNRWKISFPHGWGIAVSPIDLDQLKAWKDIPSLTEEGRAFSGTGVYHTSFEMNEIYSNTHYFLDLGQVEMIAKVRLNGVDIATRWTYPYKMEITPYLQPGENSLEIAVTSTWFNRLSYDAGLPDQLRKTWTINAPEADSPLIDYGLLGPVSITMKKK